jgi:hypothetical protein
MRGWRGRGRKRRKEEEEVVVRDEERMSNAKDVVEEEEEDVISAVPTEGNPFLSPLVMTGRSADVEFVTRRKFSGCNTSGHNFY